MTSSSYPIKGKDICPSYLMKVRENVFSQLNTSTILLLGKESCPKDFLGTWQQRKAV